MKKLFFGLFLMPFGLFGQAIQFTSACGAQTFCFGFNACAAGTIAFTASATGGCGGPLEFSWDLDLGANGTIEKEGLGASINEAVATAGPHKVKFLAKDNCGGAASCTLIFNGKDCQPPTLLLISGLSQSLQQPNCTATVDPKIFVTSASDNCSTTAQITYAIRKTGTGTGFPATPVLIVPACEVGTIPVEIWAKDAAGNAGFYNTYVLVQASVGVCECLRDTVLFSGKLMTINGLGAVASNFVPTISGGSSGFPAVLTPLLIDSSSGAFTFKAIARVSPNPYSVKIEPKKAISPTNGLSAFDLVLITKHILGAETFDSVYKMAAGDSNLDGSVSVSDIVELRKMILGLISDFPLNTSWRFVETVADPTDLSKASSLKEKKNLQFTVHQGQSVPDFLNLDFKAVKIGDLNGSADPKN